VLTNQSLNAQPDLSVAINNLHKRASLACRERAIQVTELVSPTSIGAAPSPQPPAPAKLASFFQNTHPHAPPHARCVQNERLTHHMTMIQKPLRTASGRDASVAQAPGLRTIKSEPLPTLSLSLVLRTVLLFLSQRRALRHWMETSPAAQRLTSRFIAGTTLQQELAVCQNLDHQGILATLDHLGESVTSLAEAERSRDAYLAALDQISARNLRATVSVKPTQLGLSLSEEACRDNVERLVIRAKSVGSVVEIDMESSAFVDPTLALVYRLHESYGCVRAVIQAYLYRSESDIENLCNRKIPVRLCKGAYKEPSDIAFPDKNDVDKNYVRLMTRLLDAGTYPAIASHDEKIINQALQYVKERNIAPDRFEFQMLFGISRELQKRLVAGGHRLRLYVPYGDAWYPYFMRRLAERPANVVFLARNLLKS
jgi:proline dehydrogenase